MVKYTLKYKNGDEEVMVAKNISDLRHKLNLLFYPGDKVDVYSSTGRKMGSYSRGMNAGFWMTPSRKFYELFRDGTIRGVY